ncbi:MAG: DUF1415 domain-containing protein [Pseudomonadales bacterium]|nr:DUF1415 domain-containing protein [Pseudomonadales bacterium]
MSELVSVKKWLDSFVIDLNLCPFAKSVKENIRYTLSEATSEEALLIELQHELLLLDSSSNIETILLVHPKVLQDFGDYNQFLDITDGLLASLDFDEKFQIASFHPEYQFYETLASDVSNYTNRSPFPMLHILRESSMTLAIENHPDVANVPDRNIALLEAWGLDKVRRLRQSCFDA